MEEAGLPDQPLGQNLGNEDPPIDIDLPYYFDDDCNENYYEAFNEVKSGPGNTHTVVPPCVHNGKKRKRASTQSKLPFAPLR